MKPLTRIFFLASLFSTSVCLADALEEELELNSDLLVPIICHFNDSSSSTRHMSQKLIEQQKNIGVQFNDYTVSVCQDEIWATKAFNDIVDRICKVDQQGKRLTSKWVLRAWQHKASNCGSYANLAIFVFEFNRMNNLLLGRSVNFKKAMFIETVEKTGNHTFILVEGTSGTMFAVDPWIWKVARLPRSFINLFDIPIESVSKAPDGGDVFYLPIKLNQKLNHLFKNPFYDGQFVKESTMWQLRLSYSKNILNSINNYSEDIKELYTTLKPNFPQLVLNYDSLFPNHVENSVISTNSSPSNDNVDKKNGGNYIHHIEAEEKK